jgi:CubicO group peptidase (beta-lactamase class C family)
MLLPAVLAVAVVLAVTPALADPPRIRDPKAEQAWLDHGRTEAERDRIRGVMTAAIDRKLIPGGSVLILHRGDVVLREAFGVADLETGRPFTIDAPCRIASVTKPHTSTLMAMLIQEGLLAWDDPVDKYLPEFKGITVRGQGPAARTPLIRELLSHTAGFPGNQVTKAGRWPIRREGPLSDIVKDIAAKGLVAEPGQKYAYTGLGYMTAGRVMEVVTGKEFSELMTQRLLQPIGAAHARFLPPEEVRSQIPSPYDRAGGSLKPINVAERMESAPNVPNPGGGLVATLDDVARLALLHLNKGKVGDRQLVAHDSLRALYVPQPGSRGDGYGLGFNTMKLAPDGYATRVRHVGASGPILEIDFKNDLAVIVFTQVPQSAQLRDRVIQETYRAFGVE